MRLNLKCLYLIGLWPPSNTGFKLNIYSLRCFIFIGVFMTIHNIFRFIKLFLIISDLQAVAGIIFLICTEILTCIKTIIFIRNIQTLKRLISELNRKTNQPKSVEQRALCLYDIKLWMVLSLSLYSIALFTLIKWVVAPLFNLQSRNLPFVAWYPFDTTQTYIYETIYVHQTISFFVSATVNSNIDAFVAYLMLYIGCQCEILCNNLKMMKWSTNFKSNFLHCIRHHKFTIRYTSCLIFCLFHLILCSYIIDFLKVVIKHLII